MSCYHPIAAFPDYSELTKNGKRKYKLTCAYQPGFRELDPNVLKIPCGKCLGCRLDYSRRWAVRMILELSTYKGVGVFVTLTYNETYVPIACDFDGAPIGYTLLKRDLQLFFKRLRKAFPERRIKYYACGEYGGHTRRPHYHAVIFGLGLSDFGDLRKVGMNELQQPYFTSEKFEDLWSAGFICLSEVSYKTCAYVSRYTMKKAYNLDTPEGLQPEFVLMSRRPGIGAKYLEEHPDCLDYSSISLADPNGSVKVSLPKYFLDKLKLTDPERYDKFIEERRLFSNDRDLLKLQNTSLSYDQLLDLEEKSFLNKTKILFNLREEDFHEASCQSP